MATAADWQQEPTQDKAYEAEGCDEESFDTLTEPTSSTGAQHAEDENGSTDEFGGFGDEVDDFVDFVEAPAIASAGKVVHGGLSIDTVLAHTSALFGPAKDHSACVGTIQKCLAQVFDDCDLSSVTPTVSERHPALLTRCKLESCIESLATLSNTSAAPEPEPRLLQNMLVVALSTNLSDDVRMRLLTPSSELFVEEVRTLDNKLPAIALYDIDKVRQIASGSGQPTLSQLSRALGSLNNLITDKEQEVARRKDTVLAYNQVVQTLVAQASKLH
ncbi:hypothetical protein GGI20_002423 [Coemansia sp. BCRC 34301]|nr:hypothetical protein GGI20_002423 [Coemansia sp. BCRC 34301]